MKMTVLGAGTMGHGIALVAAQSRCLVKLCDLNLSLAEQGKSRAAAFLDQAIAKGKVPPSDRQAILDRITPTASLEEAAAWAEVVIEAVPEQLPLKQHLFRTISGATHPHTILATNTSSLSIDRIADAARDPSRVIGMHFFNPPPLMKLLEVVKGSRTAPDVLQQTVALGQRLGKEVIVVKDTPGFATSRLGVTLALEAMRMLEEGVASAEDIDKAMELGYHHPMGPLKLTDFIGLDVRLAIAEYLHQTFQDDRYAPPAILKRLVAEGKLGKKTGQGFYRW